MKNLMESNVTGVLYDPDEFCKIMNFKQVMYYISNDVYPVDIYASKDYKTGDDNVVFVFNKKQTHKFYLRWMSREVNLEEEIHETVQDYSHLLQKEIRPEDTVRVLNFKQASYYLQNGQYPVDIAIVRDYKTGNMVLSLFFDRDNTRELFTQWRNR